MGEISVKNWLDEVYTPTKKSVDDLVRLIRQARMIIESQQKELEHYKALIKK